MFSFHMFFHVVFPLRDITTIRADPSLSTKLIRYLGHFAGQMMKEVLKNHLLKVKSMHGFPMNIHIISAFELTITNFTIKGDEHVFSFNVFVQVCCFIRRIITLSAGPGHETIMASCLHHLPLHNFINS